MVFKKMAHSSNNGARATHTCVMSFIASQLDSRREGGRESLFIILAERLRADIVWSRNFDSRV